MNNLSKKVAVCRELVCDAVMNLVQTGLRNVLAILGIGVGTAAVVAMLHLGHNARREAMRQFETLGVDLFLVTPGQTPDAGQVSIPLSLAMNLSTALSGIHSAAPFILTGGSLRSGRETIHVNLVAVPDEFYAIGAMSLFQGRFTSFLDKAAARAVIGSSLAGQIGHAQGKPVTIGTVVEIDGQMVTVIGILGFAYPNHLLNIDPTRDVFISLSAARRFTTTPVLTGVAARFAPGVDVAVASAAIEDYFRRSMRHGSVVVQTAHQLIDGMERQMRIYSHLLLAIGAVSLCVGGIGVMNVLLMSVMERRQEIGLRRALGARRRDIGLMFLAEALVLSSIGCLVGTAAGWAVGWGFSRFSGWQFEASMAAWPLGIGVACAVGIVSGSYPAHRAAQLDPIVALRG